MVAINPASDPSDDTVVETEELIQEFNLLEVKSSDDRARGASALPRSLILGVWNCRGIASKHLQIANLFEESEADIIVLNETFRKAGTPWPALLPPCLAEATAAADSSETRPPAGVAVLLNPRNALGDGRIKRFEILESDNVLGTKVVIRVNNVIIFAVYCPPSVEGEQLLATYGAEAADLASNGSSVVFCGDLNVVPPLSPATYNMRSRWNTLVSSLPPALFFRGDTGGTPTRPSNRSDSVNLHGNILDHVFGANTNLCEGKVLDAFAHTSDHHPVLIRVVPQIRGSDSSTKYCRVRVEKLSQESVRTAYMEALSQGIDLLESKLADFAGAGAPHSALEQRKFFDRFQLEFDKFVMDTAIATLGVRRVPLVPLKPAIVPSDEYTQTRVKLAEVYEELRKWHEIPPDHPLILMLLGQLSTLKTELSLLEKADANRRYQEWYHKLADLSHGARMKLIRRIGRRRVAVGQSLATTPIALASHRDYFAKQFTNPFVSDPFGPVDPTDSDEVHRLALEIFDESNVLASLHRTPRHKAPGLSGVSADLLLPGADVLAPLLGKLFCVYFANARIPSSWTRALICPVPKKGDLSRVSNYRPISLTEVTRKVFELCLLDHLNVTISLSPEQGGFRQGRSTLDQIEALGTVIDHIRRDKKHKRAHLAFLDIKAAYDSVPRPELWKRCAAIGVDAPTIKILQSLFDHNTAQLALANCRSAPFSLPAGVLQGSVLSPLLYSVYLDPLVEKLKAEGPLIPYTHIPGGVNCLLYADDIVLIADSSASLKKLLAIAETDSNKRGYCFSASKCVVVAPGRPKHKLYGQVLEKKDCFTYLGVEVTCKGLARMKHAEKRIAKAEAAVKSLRASGARPGSLPARALIQLYKSVVRPSLEYGLPLLAEHAGAIQALDRSQRCILKSWLGLPPFASTDILLAFSGCPPIPIRLRLTQHRRINKLQGRWNSEWWPDFALLLVRKGFLDRNWAVDNVDLRLNADPKWLLQDWFRTPTTQRLSDRYDQALTLPILERLLKAKISYGFTRLLLLWFVESWRPFTLRFCRKCGSPISSQWHVIECTSLVQTLAEDPLLPPLLPLESIWEFTPSPNRIVERYARVILAQHSPPPVISQMLEKLGTLLCDSLRCVYGDLNSNTYA